MIRKILQKPECFANLPDGYGYMIQTEPTQNEIIGYIAYRYNGHVAEVVMFFVAGALQDRQGITEDWMIVDAQWMKTGLLFKAPDKLPIKQITVMTVWPCKIWNKVAEAVFGAKPMRMYVCSQEV